jgi:predicted Zn-dependent peptidase
MKNTKTVTVLVLVGAGSNYETKDINGVSHFLEHMFFKGTKKRPNALAIAETLDRVGGQYNAFTGREYTGYWAKVDSRHLDLALDWVSDIFLNSKLESQEIERERGVITEEINMYLDTPIEHISDLWEELLYGNQPAGWSVIGKKEVIARIKRENFINYLKEHYLAKNTIVIVAGDADKIQSQKSKIKSYFTNIKAGKPQSKERTVEKQKKPQVLLHYKKTDQTHFYLGVRAYDVFDERKYALGILAVILGGNMSSRLWIAVREREGLAYYISTSADAYTDHGYLATHAGIDNNRVEKAIEIILKEYKKITQEKVSEAELKKAKDYIKGNTTLGLESSDAIATFVGAQEILTNKILTLEEKFAKIEAVTVDDIYKVARDIFQPKKLNLALIGPFKNKKKFDKLLKL